MKIPFSNIRLSFFIGLPFYIYTAAVLMMFLSGADMAMGKNRLLPLPATLAAVILIGSLSFIGIIRDLLRKPAGKQALQILGRNQSAIISFLFVVVISLLFSGHPTAYWGEKGKWIFLIAYGFLIFLISMLLPITPGIKRNYKVYTILSALILLGSMLMDVYNPGYFSTVVSRAAGFPGNSNLGSVIMILLCAASLNYNMQRAMLQDFLVFAIALIAMFLTQSRSGALELLSLIVFYMYINFTKYRVSAKTIITCVLGVSISGVILAIAIPFLLGDAAMFQQYNTRVSHIMSSSQIDDGSSDSRKEAALAAVLLAEKAPIWGHGTGYTRRMYEPPHNIYLQQWVNNGIFGLAAYLALLITGYVLFKKRKFYAGQALILVAGIGGIFSHNMLDQRPFLMLYGMLLTLSLSAEPK